MLQICASQMSSLGEQAWRRFVDAMLAHVRETWPATCEKLGLEATRGALMTTANRAREHGFETEYDVGRFIHLAFAFENLQFTQQDWARPIMADGDLPPRVRMNQLFAAALSHLEARDATP